MKITKTKSLDSNGGLANQPTTPTLPRKDKKMKTPEQLADEHWKYVKTLLETYGKRTTKREEFHYKTAMIHGIKHGREEEEK
jgi:hypothetical protein